MLLLLLLLLFGAAFIRAVGVDVGVRGRGQGRGRGGRGAGRGSVVTCNTVIGGSGVGMRREGGLLRHVRGGADGDCIAAVATRGCRRHGRGVRHGAVCCVLCTGGEICFFFCLMKDAGLRNGHLLLVNRESRCCCFGCDELLKGFTKKKPRNESRTPFSFFFF